MKHFFTFLIISLVTFSCSKDERELSLNSEKATLNAKGTHQVIVQGSSDEQFNYSSDNNLIAEVDNNGLVTANKVGVANITVSGPDFFSECEITIIPEYYTFEEPVTEFGISKDAVKAKENRTLLNETDDGLIYEGANLEKYAIYVFEDGKLSAGCIVLSHSYTSELGSYMIERYVIVSSDPAIGYSVNKSFTVGAELQSDLDWWVIYFPYTETKSASLTSKANDLINKYEGKILELQN